MEVYIESGPVAADPVHLWVAIPPHVSLSELMEHLQGRSSRQLLDEFSELNHQFWGKPSWARGYLAARSGKVTEDIIQPSIESHGQPLPPPGDGSFTIGDE